MSENPALTKPIDGTTTGTVNNPFARTHLPEHISAGSVEIESQRAIGEVQAKLVIAKRFPRDPYTAFNRLMEQCQRYDFAEKASYAYKRGNETVSGASIRMAEEIARCYGNLEYGLRELSQKDGESEMEAFAWDMETNVISSHRFTVKHKRETKSGTYDLKSERDIYEATANMGARRMRARILAIVPPEFTDAAIAECKKTVAKGNGKSIEERRKDMAQAFNNLGVNTKMLEDYTAKKINQLTQEDIAALIEVYQAIKQGASSKETFFGAPTLDAPSEVKQAAKQKTEAKPATKKPEPKKEPAQAESPKEETPVKQSPADDPLIDPEALFDTEKPDNDGFEDFGD